jgi:hypothetical protein
MNKTMDSKKNVKLPVLLQPLLWSKNINRLNIDTDKIYIIHQILAYGSLKHIRLLNEIYPDEVIKNTFINFPKSVYTKPVFLFVKNFLLEINDRLNEKDYIKRVI